MQDWTTPKDLTDQVLRIWNKGRILAAKFDGASLFPLPLRLRRPTNKAISERFEEVRQWIRLLEECARSRRGFGYVIEWAEINHRQLGRNRVPVAVSVPSERDALKLIGKEKEATRFDELYRSTVSSFPNLSAWLTRKPLTVLDNASEWPQILSVVAWFQDHPNSNLYVRQLDIAGVDTKFVESRKGLFAELLDIVLARPSNPPPGTIAQAFEQRYGLKGKTPTIRFRILDHKLAIGGLLDIAIPADQFATLVIPARRVFIAENEVNGLAFPDVQDSIVIFGLGYSIDLLHPILWMKDRDIYYWGDIDTHGFAMLDRLRAAFPSACSLLMDRETLLAHRSLWVREDTPFRGALSRLAPNEHELFLQLINNNLGEAVRLEQERISFARLQQELLNICKIEKMPAASDRAISSPAHAPAD